MQRAGPRHPTAGPASSSVQRPLEADLHSLLNEYLLLENKFQPKLCLPSQLESGEVTIGARDGAAHVLRCLKAWYDLPVDVLINAVSLFDRFLTKMKVRPCHVPCITAACMLLALDQHAKEQNTPRVVSVEEIVSISQSACTAGDVVRMSRVIADKLSAASGAITALHWLRLIREILDVQESDAEKLLEIVICDAACANARLSELALVLLYHSIEQQMVSWSASGQEVPESAYALFEVGAQLQAHCRMSDACLMSVRSRVRGALSRYEARTAAPSRQRLVWRLSSRTLKVLRPTDRLGSLLPTIEEQQLAPPTTPPRNRSGSESSESEETCDWPRSPVLPVYCDA